MKSNQSDLVGSATDATANQCPPPQNLEINGPESSNQ